MILADFHTSLLSVLSSTVWQTRTKQYSYPVLNAKMRVVYEIQDNFSYISCLVVDLKMNSNVYMCVGEFFYWKSTLFCLVSNQFYYIFINLIFNFCKHVLHFVCQLG